MNPAVEYVGRVLDDPATTLDTAARFVLVELARHWNRRSQTAWIGQGRVNDDGTRTGLQKTTGLSERTIRYAFRQIEAAGHAVPEARPGKSTVWRFPAVDAALADTPAPGAPLHLVHPSQTPAPDAPRHLVPPSNERRAARGAPTPARGAPTPARGAPEPLKEPGIRTRAPAAEHDAPPMRHHGVVRCPNLPPRRNAWCHADCEQCHGVGHVRVEQLPAAGSG